MPKSNTIQRWLAGVDEIDGVSGFAGSVISDDDSDRRDVDTRLLDRATVVGGWTYPHIGRSLDRSAVALESSLPSFRLSQQTISLRSFVTSQQLSTVGRDSLACGTSLTFASTHNFWGYVIVEGGQCVDIGSNYGIVVVEEGGHCTMGVNTGYVHYAEGTLDLRHNHGDKYCYRKGVCISSESNSA